MAPTIYFIITENVTISIVLVLYFGWMVHKGEKTYKNRFGHVDSIEK